MVGFRGQKRETECADGPCRVYRCLERLEKRAACLCARQGSVFPDCRRRWKMHRSGPECDY